MKTLLIILAVAFVLAELRMRGQITAAAAVGTPPAPAQPNVIEIPYGGGTGEQLYPSDPWTPTGPGAQIPVSQRGVTVGVGTAPIAPGAPPSPEQPFLPSWGETHNTGL